MKVAQLLLPEIKVSYVRLTPSANFRDMATHFPKAVFLNGEIIGYDYLCDLTDFRGDAFQSDAQRIADEYCRHPRPDHQTYTCFVTKDAGFGYWAAAMDQMFPGRTHLVFPNLLAAWTRLDALRGRSNASRPDILPEPLGGSPIGAVGLDCPDAA